MNQKTKIKNIIKSLLPAKRISKEEVRDPNLIQKIQPTSLLFYYSNIYSQLGQDGILSEIFRRLNIKKGYFVEFGGWDGIYLSNCRWLFEQGWDGTFIEGNEETFKILRNNYKSTPRINCINKFVEPKGYNSIDSILDSLKIDIESIEFISIDIDGRDLENFENLSIKPKIVLIEGGYSWSPYLQEKVSNEVASQNLQQPLPVIIELARSKGYEPVCFHQDTYLVRSDLFHHFSDIKNNALTLYKEGFYFLTKKHRNTLIDFRNSNIIIKEIESHNNVPFLKINSTN